MVTCLNIALDLFSATKIYYVQESLNILFGLFQICLVTSDVAYKAQKGNDFLAFSMTVPREQWAEGNTAC